MYFLLSVQCRNNDETIDLKIQIVDQRQEVGGSLTKNLSCSMSQSNRSMESTCTPQPFINIIWGQSQRFWEDLTSKADFSLLLKFVWQNKYTIIMTSWMPKCKIDLNDNRKTWEMPLTFWKYYKNQTKIQKGGKR